MMVEGVFLWDQAQTTRVLLNFKRSEVEGSHLNPEKLVEAWRDLDSGLEQMEAISAELVQKIDVLLKDAAGSC